MAEKTMAENRAGGTPWPGVVLGLGLGGFIDGIVLHQILQWHHMVCDTPDCRPLNLPAFMQTSTADGLFHAAAWIVTFLGVVLVYRAARAGKIGSIWSFTGALIAGWGLFNLVEGTIDHYILQIHHVRPGPNQAAWDFAFLAASVVLIAVGGWMVRKSARNV